MAAGDVMTGSITALVEDYVTLRRSLGYRSPSQERALRAFAGKRGRMRLVPLHPSALAPLRDYAAEREQRYGPPGDAAAFFRTDRSDHISYNAANHTFTVLRRQLGWTAAGRTRAPRVHDLRHRMVVRRIQAWHAQGVDVDRNIAVLATYLGHVEVRDVYWYLSAAPELMSIIANRFEAFARYPPAGVS
jgi:integrase